MRGRCSSSRNLAPSQQASRRGRRRQTRRRPRPSSVLKCEQRAHRILGDWSADGSKTEHRVAIHHRVDRPDGTGHPVVRDRSKLAGLGLRQDRICQNHANGGGKRGLRLCVRGRQRFSLGMSWRGKQLRAIRPPRPVAGSTADPTAFTTTAAATETPEASWDSA